MAAGDVTISEWFYPTQQSSFFDNFGANVEADDGVEATATFTGTGAGEQKTTACYNFQNGSAQNFSLPAGAELRGIEVEVQCRVDDANEVTVSWSGCLSNDFPDTTAFRAQPDDPWVQTVGTTEAEYTFGGPTWNMGKIMYNDASSDSFKALVHERSAFGIFLPFKTIGTSTTTVRVDYLRIRFHYWASADIPTNTGWVLVGTGIEQGTFDEPWTNETNITEDAGAIAFTNIEAAAGALTNKLIGHNLGLGLPADATVDGIEVTFDMRGAYNPGFTDQRVNLVELVFNSGGSPAPAGNAGTDRLGRPVHYTGGGQMYPVYGDWNDLWSEVSITDTQVEHTNFGASCQFIEDDATGGGGPGFHVQNMYIRVHYNNSGGGGGGGLNEGLICPIF